MQNAQSFRGGRGVGDGDRRRRAGGDTGQRLVVLAAVLAALAGLGTWDLIQTKHSILRAYPILGHARWLAERIRPEIYQYFVESNTDGAPFDRETRDMVYSRAKGTRAMSRSAPSATSTPSATSSCGIHCGRRSPPIWPRGCASAGPTAASPTTSRCSTSRR